MKPFNFDKNDRDPNLGNELLIEIMKSLNHLSMMHDSEEISFYIVEAIKKIFGFNIILISILDEKKELLNRIAYTGITQDDFESLKRKPVEFCTIERVLQDKFKIGNCYFVSGEDTSENNHGGYRPDRSSNQLTWNPEDMLLITIKDSKDEVMGLISMDDPVDKKVPSPEKLNILSLFCESAGNAYLNSRLIEQNNKRVKRYIKIQDITSVIINFMESEILLEKTLEILEKVYKDFKFWILLKNNNGDSFRIYSRIIAKAKYFNLGGESLQTFLSFYEQPLIINDFTNQNINTIIYSETNSELVIPIKYKSDVIGILFIESEEKSIFTVDDLEMFLSFARILGVSIKNAEEYQEKLYLSSVDHLTGFYTKKNIKMILSEEIKKAKWVNDPLTLLIVSIDGFIQYVNDYSDLDNSTIIKAFSDTIRLSKRDTDIIGMYRFNKYLIILPQTSKQDAFNIAERQRLNFKRLNIPLRDSMKSVNLTLSFGVAAFPEDGTIDLLLVSNAEEALKQAIRNGGDNVAMLSIP